MDVPPEDPSYTLKYVWLTKDENVGYYFGYSNQALWPLMHLAFVRPVIRDNDWRVYKDVNKKFATAVYDEIKGKKAVALSRITTLH